MIFQLIERPKDAPKSAQYALYRNGRCVEFYRLCTNQPTNYQFYSETKGEWCPGLSKGWDERTRGTTDIVALMNEDRADVDYTNQTPEEMMLDIFSEMASIAGQEPHGNKVTYSDLYYCFNKARDNLLHRIATNGGTNLQKQPKKLETPQDAEDYSSYSLKQGSSFSMVMYLNSGDGGQIKVLTENMSRDILKNFMDRFLAQAPPRKERKGTK
jgi:hypothetical protein